jgi:hypothetical protein
MVGVATPSLVRSLILGPIERLANSYRARLWQTLTDDCESAPGATHLLAHSVYVIANRFGRSASRRNCVSGWGSRPNLIDVFLLCEVAILF